MKHPVNRFLSYLSKKGHSVCSFLNANGFFEEIIRNTVKLVFFIIMMYLIR